jgi:hypothetical protein
MVNIYYQKSCVGSFDLLGAICIRGSIFIDIETIRVGTALL